MYLRNFKETHRVINVISDSINVLAWQLPAALLFRESVVAIDWRLRIPSADHDT
jgi:hypothetical protein